MRSVNQRWCASWTSSTLRWHPNNVCVGGELLAGSGWERMFSLVQVFTPGVAAALLGASYVKRARYSYQLTLAWLHVLKVQAYNEYCQTGYGSHEPVEMWEKRLTANAPTVCTGQQFETIS